MKLFVNPIVYTILAETWTLLSLIFSLYIIEILFTMLMQMTIIFAGYLPQENSEILAGVSLAQSFIIFFGFFVFVNLTSALHTLASQANGAEENKYLGLLLQRSIWISLFISLPVAIIWANTENVLAIFNQNDRIIETARKYISISYALIPAFIIIFVFQNLIEMMNILKPIVLIFSIGNVVAGLVGYLTCFVLKWEVYSIPIIMILSLYSVAIGLFVYCKCFGIFDRIWHGWKLAGFYCWGKYLYYGVPILFTELALNIQVYGSGFIIGINAENATIALSINSVMVSLDMITYTLSVSISIAASVRIGNLIGEGNLKLAKISIIILGFIASILSLLQGIVLYLSRHVIGNIFTNNIYVVEGVSSVLILLAFAHPLDTLFGYFQGVLRGMGKQDYGMILTISDVIVSLPTSLVLTLPLRMGVWGYWMGPLVGCAVSILASGILCVCCYQRIFHMKKVELHSSGAKEHAPLIENLTDRNLLNNDENLMMENARLRFPYFKLASFLLFLAIFILTLGCKLGNRSFLIPLNKTYLKSPIELCCIKLIPLK